MCTLARLRGIELKLSAVADTEPEMIQLFDTSSFTLKVGNNIVSVTCDDQGRRSLGLGGS